MTVGLPPVGVRQWLSARRNSGGKGRARHSARGVTICTAGATRAVASPAAGHLPGGNQVGAPRRVHTVSDCMDPAARHVRPRGPRVRYSPSVEDQRPQLGGELGPDLLQRQVDQLGAREGDCVFELPLDEVAEKIAAHMRRPEQEVMQRAELKWPAQAYCSPVHAAAGGVQKWAAAKIRREAKAGNAALLEDGAPPGEAASCACLEPTAFAFPTHVLPSDVRLHRVQVHDVE